MSRSEEIEIGSAPYSHMLKFANANQTTRLFGAKFLASKAPVKSSEFKIYDAMADRASRQELRSQKYMAIFPRGTIKKHGQSPVTRTDEFWNN